MRKHASLTTMRSTQLLEGVEENISARQFCPMLQKWIFAYKLTCRSQGCRFSQGNFRPNELLTLFFARGNCQYTRDCLYTILQDFRYLKPRILIFSHSYLSAPKPLLSLPTGHDLKPIFIKLGIHKCHVNPKTINFSTTVQFKFYFKCG